MLVRWLQVSGSGGLMATKDEQEDLLKEISFDIMPMQDIIKVCTLYFTLIAVIF